MDGAPGGWQRRVAWLGASVAAALMALVGWLAVARPAAGLVAAVAGRPAADVLGDTAPAVVALEALPGSERVPLTTTLTVTFSEPVALGPGAAGLVCERSGDHVLTGRGGDTVFDLVPAEPLAAGEQCAAQVLATGVSDLDADDPPDQPPIDTFWTFRARPAPPVINEVDTLTAGGAADFVELFDGGAGHTSLDGLVLVFFRGDAGTVYLALELRRWTTDERGFFVAGAQGTPGADLLLADGTLRDGLDAVALYEGAARDFPVGQPVTTAGLLDAVVYGPAGMDAGPLTALLLPGEKPLDESAAGDALGHSLQRYPDGQGQPRRSTAFGLGSPTPDGPNRRLTDAAPEVIGTAPAAGAIGVRREALIEVTFSEPVRLRAAPLEIVCEISGNHGYSVAGGPVTFRFQPYLPLAPGETCRVAVLADGVSDLDESDPPDGLRQPVSWAFMTIPTAAELVVINEVDADTPGPDAAEFIELYDGGRGNTVLDGLLVVLFNGADDRSYGTIDLRGQRTDGSGYFVLANAAVSEGDLMLPNARLQNGPDAVALVAGSAAEFPNGTPVSATVPVAAVVYGRADRPDEGLRPLLDAGQPQIDENGRGAGETHANQRCPNGAGGARQTAGFRQNAPTPGATNDCVTDTPPSVVERAPGPGASEVSLSSDLRIVFSEPVAVRSGWATIECALSGVHDYTTLSDAITFTLRPTQPFARAETCVMTLKSRLIADVDNDDPPDQPIANMTWQFQTMGPVADFTVINELDPDTPSSDTAEFIELYDGGRGSTDLGGLSLVFYNGYTNSVYRALDLDGQRTDARGYWLGGNAALAPSLVFPNGALQNGPDAVALYAADAAQFPVDTPVVTRDLIDAVVYGRPGEASAVLLSLLLAGEEAADESGRSAAEQHSLQRCPNGTGGPRQTTPFLANSPTPGAASNCALDAAPAVTAVRPPQGAIGVPTGSIIEVTFNEPVAAASGWIALTCAVSGQHTLTTSGGPLTFRAAPDRSLAPGETCTVQLIASAITDTDADDPPDSPTEGLVWTFATAQAPPPEGVLINELDADTPGSDAAEFIELYDGGAGNTDLSGLALVLFNGADDRAYYALDLTGVRTNAAGFALVGNADVPGSDVTLPKSILQNGPDAAALYAGRAADFPPGATLTTANLVDALVYGTGDPVDPGLGALLEAGELPVDEAARGAADRDSSQRCPDGTGSPRRTGSYRQNEPTPGYPNRCINDDAPAVARVTPPAGAVDVVVNAPLAITFSEPVALEAEWYDLDCEASGQHEAVASGGPLTFQLEPGIPFAPGETCSARVVAAAVHDLDADDPPDTPTGDFTWTFTITTPPPPQGILINELDADTPGSDTAEFIELYDGGAGGTDLAGIVLVLYNGADDQVYYAVDLNGLQTNASGFALIGSADVPHVGVVLPRGILQNGLDAVALYAGRAADFPPGAPLTTSTLLDALVYGTSDLPDSGLAQLLESGQAPVDENARGTADRDSSQRCPDGSGGPRRTGSYRQNAPTPGGVNDCVVDEPPAVVRVTPASGATGVARDSALAVVFSEPVALDAGWHHINCAVTGDHEAEVTGGPEYYDLAPTELFAAGETCSVKVLSAAVHDRDSNDPPDGLADDYRWSFTVAVPVPPQGILINELDSDTPGRDTAEFIELTDGGRGATDLTGLALVLWNGGDGAAYRVIDLAGHRTNSAGYFVLGGPEVPGANLPLPASALQNGPDAVALYDLSAGALRVGMPLSTAGLRDALVYGATGGPNRGLLALLEPAEAMVDENGRGRAAQDSLQRCPDGAGGPRRTAAYQPTSPSPGTANACTSPDETPQVMGVWPADGAAAVPLTVTLTISFSEPVALDENWIALECDGRDQPVQSSMAGSLAHAAPLESLPGDAACTARVSAAAVHDQDTNDPPDGLPEDVVWRFTTATVPPPVVAAFASNSPVWVGEAVVFYNTSTGAGSLAFVWVFGDGEEAAMTNPTHRYARPGTYPVTLTATGVTAASVTHLVEVRPRVIYLPAMGGP